MKITLDHNEINRIVAKYLVAHNQIPANLDTVMARWLWRQNDEGPVLEISQKMGTDN